jgi:hypothetical protein
MSLPQWAKNGWLRPYATNRQQVASLLAIAERDLEDAAQGISDDWKFGIAYNAALKLCTVLLYCEGYRAEKNLAGESSGSRQFRPVHAFGVELAYAGLRNSG